MRRFTFLIMLCGVYIGICTVVSSNSPGQTLEALRSPVNQVFQFMQPGSCSKWSDGSTNKAVAYLWIPDHCRRVRGLVILCTNVPEHMLAGHPAIRDVCTNNDLGIVFCAPSFMNFRKGMPQDYATSVGFLQQLLDGLAASSGYSEVATVPWLPIGESGHLLMVDALVEYAPQRCIAGVWLKNNHLPPKDRKTPALVIYGTSQEWSQDKSDIRSKWNDIGGAYEGILKQLQANPQWPLSYVIDGTSGHFDCSEKLVDFLSAYIDAVCKARLYPQGGDQLKPIDLKAGYVADLPVPGHENHAVVGAGKGLASLPWYFNTDQAERAQKLAAINWSAATQFPGFIDTDGKVLPYNFNGIANLKSVRWEADQISFAVHSQLLDKIPDGFASSGEPLSKTPGDPVMEWLCGPIAPLGEGRFRISLDRTYGAAACYLAARKAGNSGVREIVEPLGVSLNDLKNNQGHPQKITFAPIPDTAMDTAQLELSAKSDSGLPVEFFVVAGPAIIKGNALVFTKIPPRSRLPLKVTVAAWQWGSSVEPRIKTAEVARESFDLVGPANGTAINPPPATTKPQ